MNVKRTAIAEVLIIEPAMQGDKRGFFFEAYQARRYESYGISALFVQDNVSHSSRGVLRGLHLQNPRSQGKLVSVLRGRVLDVAVDVRLGSPTFGKHVAAELSDEDHRQIWIPRGFAHGFLVLSNRRIFFTNATSSIAALTRLRCAGTIPRLALSGAMAVQTFRRATRRHRCSQR